MANQALSVKATGVKELRAALKQAEDRTPQELSKAHRRIADVAAERGRAFAAGGYLSARAAATIRSSGTQTSGRILVGSDAVPWALGNEFGGGGHPAGHPTSRGGYTSQFKPWRGSNTDAGYGVFPALRAMGPQIEDMYWQELHALAALGFA